MTIRNAIKGQTYMVKDILTDDEEMKNFLFRLGCYEGEPITLIAAKRNSCTVAIKQGRYNFDNFLADAILV